MHCAQHVHRRWYVLLVAYTRELELTNECRRHLQRRACPRICMLVVKSLFSVSAYSSLDLVSYTNSLSAVHTYSQLHRSRTPPRRTAFRGVRSQYHLPRVLWRVLRSLVGRGVPTRYWSVYYSLQSSFSRLTEFAHSCILDFPFPHRFLQCGLPQCRRWKRQ